jgi:hypothetical protein
MLLVKFVTRSGKGCKESNYKLLQLNQNDNVAMQEAFFVFHKLFCKTTIDTDRNLTLTLYYYCSLQ